MKMEEEESDDVEQEEGLLWDLTRVLEGNCKLWLLKFEDKGGKAVSNEFPFSFCRLSGIVLLMFLVKPWRIYMVLIFVWVLL